MRGEAGLRAIGTVTLGLEVMVIFFAVLAVYGLGHSLPPVSGGLLLALAALLMLTPVLLRWSWGAYAALAVQGLVIAAGAIIAPLYVLGAIFAALWVGYLRMVSRFRAELAAAAAAEAAAVEDVGPAEAAVARPAAPAERGTPRRQ